MAIQLSGGRRRDRFTVEDGSPTPPSGWTSAVWLENFAGTSVDATKWSVLNGHIGGNEQSITYTGNVSVANNVLRIQPKLETTTFGGTTRSYTSGYLQTDGLFVATRPCLIEASMALPLSSTTSAGMWPAFWLRDPTDFGEIDVMEAWGEPSLQDGTPSEKPGGRYAAHIYPDTRTTAGGHGTWTGPSGQDLTAFHTYGVAISEDGSVQFLYDGSAAGQLSYAYTSNTFLQTSFPGGYAIRLNLQIGGAWNGPPNGSTDWSQAMQVQWVRVWTR